MSNRVLGLASIAGSAVLVLQYGFSVSFAAAAGLAVFLLANLIYWLWFATIYPYWFSPFRALPTPEGHNIFTGHLSGTLLSKDPIGAYGRWTRKWPTSPLIRHFTLGNVEAISPNTLSAIKALLQDHGYDADKSSFLKAMLREFCQGGVFFAMGDDHKRLRKLLSGPLSKPRVRTMLPIIQGCAAHMSERIEAKIDGPENGVVDVPDLSAKAILEVIGMTIVGKRLDTFRSRPDGPTFQECFRLQFFPSPIGKLIMLFNSVIPLRWIPIKANRDHFEANAEMRTMLSGLIQEKTEQIMAHDKDVSKLESDSDLFTKMILANQKEQVISNIEMLDTMVQLIMAGQASSASTLSFTLAELVRRPDVLARLRQEIAEAKAEQPVLDGQTIDNMSYVNYVIKEILRLYSPAIVLNWQATEDFDIEGVHIPKGTLLDIVPTIIHQNPTIWGEDAHLFNPGRWYELTKASSSVYAMTAFLNGPRICPGLHLGMLELKVLLIEIVDKFDFEMVNKKQDLAFINPAITLLELKDGLDLRFRHRSQ